MSRRRVVRIGLDFDGVIAYNPFRLIRAPIKWFKREVLGVRKLTFFVPENWWQRLLWSVIHESSVFPASGVDLLRQLSPDSRFEFHLITARYGFLKNNLLSWLQKNHLLRIFKTININENCLQPHEYKLQTVKRLKLDYYVEDNLDIVTYLSPKVKTKIYWVYNFIDFHYSYPYKFPYLQAALQHIISLK